MIRKYRNIFVKTICFNMKIFYKWSFFSTLAKSSFLLSPP